jgi:ELWxxDGT repeat protein
MKNKHRIVLFWLRFQAFNVNNLAKMILMVGLLIMASLAGCLGSSDRTESQGKQETSYQDEEELTDWQVHFAASTSNLPNCQSEKIGWLYYIQDQENFRVCTQFGWDIVDIYGPSGNDGEDGLDGKDGRDGDSIAMNIVAATSCLTGGKKFQFGLDKNQDGGLNNEEVTFDVDICDGPVGQEGEHGSDGANGLDGANGSDGKDGANALVNIYPETAGPNCANGGTRLDVGTDEDNSGLLEEQEIEQTQYICDGGFTNTTLLTSISPPPPLMNCDAGGRMISHGLDNGDGGGFEANGNLEPGEVDATTTFCSRYVSDDQNIRIVRDINNSPHNPAPSELTALNKSLYFVADDGVHGEELWKSDGSESGTVMVKDIYPGSFSSSPEMITVVGTAIFFVLNDGVHGYELWTSNGTSEGTHIVKDIRNGSLSSEPHNLAALDTNLIFAANEGANGFELWKSDGTENGTTMLKDVNLGANSSSPKGFTLAGNTLYFWADDGVHGVELWKTDGTLNGTVLVSDINTGANDSINQNFESAVVGDTMYFAADNGLNGTELWKSNGTSTGTMLVKDINQGQFSSSPAGFEEVSNTVFFRAYDEGQDGFELWKTDGTNNGTQMVKDINWIDQSGGSIPRNLVSISNILFFVADDGFSGEELWRSDGTTNGTMMIKDLTTGSNGSNLSSLTVVGNKLYFIRISDDSQFAELWKSDGTSSGTEKLIQFNIDPSTNTIGDLTALRRTLFFSANDSVYGGELFTTLAIESVVIYA